MNERANIRAKLLEVAIEKNISIRGLREQACLELLTRHGSYNLAEIHKVIRLSEEVLMEVDKEVLKWNAVD